jgi:hypothetical protein
MKKITKIYISSVFRLNLLGILVLKIGKKIENNEIKIM